MTQKLNITPGPWTVLAGTIIMDADRHRIASVPENLPSEAEDGFWTTRANAQLIAEAGTVAHETGLTPRQLAEQRQELLAALERARTVVALDAICSNAGLLEEIEVVLRKARGEEG